MIEVCVVGELNLDLILYGLPENPLPDHEHLASNMALTLGSSSGIFAHNLRVLGTAVGFISKIGNDPLGNADVYLMPWKKAVQVGQLLIIESFKQVTLTPACNGAVREAIKTIAIFGVVEIA